MVSTSLHALSPCFISRAIYSPLLCVELCVVSPVCFLWLVILCFVFRIMCCPLFWMCWMKSGFICWTMRCSSVEQGCFFGLTMCGLVYWNTFLNVKSGMLKHPLSCTEPSLCHVCETCCFICKIMCCFVGSMRCLLFVWNLDTHSVMLQWSSETIPSTKLYPGYDLSPEYVCQIILRVWFCYRSHS